MKIDAPTAGREPRCWFGSLQPPVVYATIARAGKDAMATERLPVELHTWLMPWLT